jgi:hypothetical protein
MQLKVYLLLLLLSLILTSRNVAMQLLTVTVAATRGAAAVTLT